MAKLSEISILEKMMAHNASNFSLVQTVYSQLCSTSIPTNQALLLYLPNLPHERQLGLIFVFIHLQKTLYIVAPFSAHLRTFSQ
jgi:hypothetical protein